MYKELSFMPRKVAYRKDGFILCGAEIGLLTFRSFADA